MNRLAMILLLILPCALAGCDRAGDVVYVSPDGNDRDTGSKRTPVQTLERARDIARASVGDVKIHLMPGVYRLDRTLVLDARDSHVCWQSDGDVTVSGARRIGGWTSEGDGSWSASVPWVANDRTNGFRRLCVNGSGRPRARLPKKGFFTVLNDDLPQGTRYNRPRSCFFYDPNQFDANWRMLENAEIVCYHFWTDSHLRISSVDPASNKVSFVTSAGKAFDTGWTNNKAGGERGIYTVENLPAAMTESGEWYLDYQAKRVFYRPMPGETPETVRVEVPFVQTLVSIDGESEPVVDVTFNGIRFALSQYELSAGDVNNAQGAAKVSAAIRLASCSGCRFDGCAFENLSGYAVRLGKGACSNVLNRCRLNRLGAGGVILDGGAAGCAPHERASGNVIADCEIGPYGEDFRSGVGVLLKNADHTRITYNRIFGGFYTGISLGWVWGYKPSACTDNEVSFNHIHGIGQGLLSDMGGIYTLGPSEGTRIVGNRIHDVDARAYGGWGIYNDEGSTGILVASNVVYDTKFAPYDIHYAKDIDVRNNIFAFGRKEQISRGKVERHVSVRFVGNIVYWQEGRLYVGNWEDQPTGGQSFIADRNVYFNPKLPKDRVRVYKALDFSSWQKNGHDVSSVYADPLFKDVVGRDFRLSAGSPAFALGFVDFNQDAVGPRPAAQKGQQQGGGR